MSRSEVTVETGQDEFCIAAEDGAIIALTWGRCQSPAAENADGPDAALLAEAGRQLKAYFAGDLKVFDLPLAPRGPDFNQQVWAEMLRIPFGEVRTYGDIAKAIGVEVAQPVGGACGANPIPVIIPCHRVVAAGGRTGGFSGGGGVDTKLKLLAHEGAKGVQSDLFMG